MVINSVKKDPWYIDLVNLQASNTYPKNMTYNNERNSDLTQNFIFGKNHFFSKNCRDQILRRYVPGEEIENILKHCHTLQIGGHFGAHKMTLKVLDFGFY